MKTVPYGGGLVYPVLKEQQLCSEVPKRLLLEAATAVCKDPASASDTF